MSSEQNLNLIYGAPLTVNSSSSLQESEFQGKSSNDIEIAPSKIQQHISEIFRIGLCRNDDYNLTISSIMKRNKKKAENKEKLIADLRNREDDRQVRENDILKELQLVNKNFSGVEKHLRKMLRKALVLTVDPVLQVQKEQTQMLLTLNAPSYLHVASIMNERTDEEKHTFGKVDLAEIKTKHKSKGGFFTEEKVDLLIETYIGQMKQPFELITKTVERSRDKFLREFAKLEASYEQSKFFTEQGVKDRKEKIKLKMLMSSLYGNSNLQENKTKGAAEIFSNVTLEEQALRMLQIHNSKTEKILKGFKLGYDLRKQAKEEGTTLDDLKKNSKDQSNDQTNETKSLKAKAQKKKQFKGFKKEVEVVIKMKGNDGAVISYDEKGSQSSSRSEKENIDDQIDTEKAKKKGTKKKTLKNKAQSSKFQSEETLEMLKNVLSSKAKPPKKKLSKQSSAVNEELKEDLKPKKEKKPTLKKVAKKKKPQDTMTRFMNAYGDTPFLQAIEDSYLKYLEQQYAKESHLKAVKKFQIMSALKRIQRFWKKKYQEIKLYCTVMIQRQSRKFLHYLKIRQLKLQRIRRNLLLIHLQRQLLIYIKKRRIANSKIRQNILQLAKLPSVLKIQAMIRSRQARRRALFYAIIRKLTFKNKIIRQLKLKTLIQRMIREKETFYVQRYALAKCEVESIMKYIQKAEEKFEVNWTTYESSLEKYLVQNKQYKDWVQKKDDVGNSHWINMKTLKAQVEHPGKQIYQANKKILKAKAEDELRDNFKPIYERRMKILDTIFDIKTKISQDFKKSRSEMLFQPYNDQETN